VAETNISRGCVDQSNQSQPLPGVAVMGKYLHVPDNSRLVSQPVSASPPTTRAAIFLDRDGVIVEDVHYLRNPAQLNILPGAAQALRRLQDHFYIIVVTNQSAIARGLLTEDDLLEIHLKLVQCLAAEGVVLDALYWCPHLSEAVVPAYKVDCDCRKPKPGMLLRAKHDWDIDFAGSFIIGDTHRDIEAGHAAGVKAILISEPEDGSTGDVLSTPNLAQAADLIIAQTHDMEPQTQRGATL